MEFILGNFFQVENINISYSYTFCFPDKFQSHIHFLILIKKKTTSWPFTCYSYLHPIISENPQTCWFVNGTISGFSALLVIYLFLISIFCFG